MPHPTVPGTAGARRASRLLMLLSLLRDQDRTTPSELALRLGVSGATVRRDLADLEQQGLLRRSHGRVWGAATTPTELPVALRDGQFREAKRRIARLAATLVPAGPAGVAINGGSTAAEVAVALGGHSGLTVMTNSLSTAVRLAAHPRLRVVMNGGWLRPLSHELVGPEAEAAFASTRFRIALLGVDGVSAAAGATTHDATEARVNRQMVLHADRVVVVADGSKVGRVTRAGFAAPGEVHDLVTDPTASDPEVRQLRALGVVVHIVPCG